MIQDNFESINYSKRDSVTYNRDGEQLEKRVEDYGSSDTLVCAQDTVKPATPGSAVTNIDEAKEETEMDHTSDRPSVAIEMGIPDSNGDVGQQHQRSDSTLKDYCRMAAESEQQEQEQEQEANEDVKG